MAKLKVVHKWVVVGRVQGFLVNSGSSRVGSLHLWVRLDRVEKNWTHVKLSCHLSFPRYNDLLVQNLRFSPISSEALARGFLWDLGCESWYEKN